METKLCRICGKFTDSYVNIFRTEGLKNKLETCLPIIVSQHCLLPDTICIECTENVDTFYSFIKNCLQNLIILEAQYDMHDSCLKSKRKTEKGTSCRETIAAKKERSTQTDEINFPNLYNEAINFPMTIKEMEKTFGSIEPFTRTKVSVGSVNLVNYDVSDDSNSDSEEPSGQVVLPFNIVSDETEHADTSLNFENFLINKQYFDNQENNLINKIAQRISLKRKSEEIYPQKMKICKYDISNRRKSRQPKKIEVKNFENVNNSNQWSTENFQNETKKSEEEPFSKNKDSEEYHQQTNVGICIPQVCLLCDTQFTSGTLLATHVFETHGIDMAQVLSSEPVLEKKKRIPNLVKIANLKTKNEQDEPQFLETTEQSSRQTCITCPLCPVIPSNRTDLYNHLRIKHPKQSSLMCGLCFSISNSYVSLNSHLETCRQNEPVIGRYICKICCYSDDAPKLIENHVIAHDFLLSFCRKQAKIFDPCDYIEVNGKCETAPKTYTCTECNSNNFEDFKDFSTHRRSQHQIFHCDLCNKFYGRNSHLWKHVNRLHKGHPSITCQLCHKTSASKYHLAQHFSKIHSAKLLNSSNSQDCDDFMKQKFQGFDFQSVKQSFMRQDLLKREQKDSVSETEGSEQDDIEEKVEGDRVKPGEKLDGKDFGLPKEIDSSSNLYTNIITNYTPPQNNGEFKCQKCFKGFHKKNLLKKHKKNCRPRLQKDLLTRCKTCSRIFKDRQSLTKHLINYHSEYACEICDQKFQSKCEIVSHIRFTHPNCHLFCSCGNILRSKSDLLAHKNDHFNSFVCQFCADSLPTKIKLKMHILSLHRKILSLSCGICLRLFETQHILRDHVRLVHKEHLMPLTSCTVCGKNYGSKWKTYDHLNKSHGRIFKACKACLEVFDSEEQLQTHYDTMHSKLIQNKTVTNSSLSGNLQSKEYESDFEHMKYDNEEKNSNSDISDDAETYAHYQSKNNSQSDCDEPTPSGVLNFVNMADENKISLLEKRLLGKKLTDDMQKKQVKKDFKAKNEKKIKNCESNIIKRDFEDNESPLQNSSKRTVYVNSNDPSLCEICLKTWPAKKHLWQHYIRCHKTVAATVCGICLKANDNYQALQKHLRENHPTLLHGQGFGSNFICRICGRYHNASSKLKLHMAIHENFDWTILDTYETNNKEKVATDNGYDHQNDKVEDVQNEINYESLIEQVECSSESEVSDEGKSQDFHENQVNNDEESSSSDASDNESEISEESSLESQMLQNMLIEKGLLQQNNVSPHLIDKGLLHENNVSPHTLIKKGFLQQNNVSPHKMNEESLLQRSISPQIFYDKNDVKQEATSSDSEESSNSSSEQENDCKNEVKSENCSSDEDDSRMSVSDERDLGSNDSTHNIFDRKPEELDSAIKSISYEQVNNANEQIVEQFCEIQSQNLNPYEIQSAVDSIL